MRRLTLPALLLAVVLVVAAASSAAPRGPVAQAQAVPTVTSSPTRDCVFLPLLHAGDSPAAAAPAQPASPDCLAPPVAPPAPSPEPPAPLTRVAGELQLRPKHAVVETTRRPTRWTIVLDVSGSMSANFAGQCDRGPGSPPPGRSYWQCANGPEGAPPIQIADVGSGYYWSAPEERRIGAAKSALEGFIAQLNLPGNPGYNPAYPSDQVGLTWFNERVARVSGSVANYSSDPAVIAQAIRAAGAYQGDPYRTSGGSNVAAGLYRAALLIDTAPRTVLHEGRSYDYRSQVVLVTDSIANQFLERSAPDLWGGASDQNSYPAGSPCRFPEVVYSAPCQTTAGGGLTPIGGSVKAGMDRPITQAGQVSQQDLRARGAEVSVVSVGARQAGDGLQDTVGSFPSSYYLAEQLQLIDGRTNLDEMMVQLLANAGPRLETQCTPVVGDWTSAIPPERAPFPPYLYPEVGEVRLVNVDTGAELRAPVVADIAAGRLTFSFEGVLPGDYTLTAALGYRGLDDQTRSYSQIELGDEQFAELFLPVSGAEQLIDTLSLRLDGDLCQQ